MNKRISLILFALVILACRNKPSSTNHETPKKPNHVINEKDKKTLDFAEPIQLDTSEYVLFPLPIKHDEGGLVFKSSGREGYYWNIIFLDTKSEKYHLLDSTRRMLIRDYVVDHSADFSEKGGSDKISNNYLFYSVIINDSNHDGILDEHDPNCLFISDKDGNNFKQISPDNFSVIDWKIIKQTHKVLISAISLNDISKDNDQRQTITFEYNLNSGGAAHQLFSDKFISETKELFKSQWPENK